MAKGVNSGTPNPGDPRPAKQYDSQRGGSPTIYIEALLCTRHQVFEAATCGRSGIGDPARAGLETGRDPDFVQLAGVCVDGTAARTALSLG
jgi:hypothetical protein